jgi:hypothetical protein
LPETLDVQADFFVEYAELFLGAAPFREVILRRPPQSVRAFLLAHGSALNHLERIWLPAAAVPDINALAGLPSELYQRIRVGLRDIPKTEVVKLASSPAVAAPPAPVTTPPAAPGNAGPIETNPARSLTQILRDLWKRIKSSR